MTCTAPAGPPETRAGALDRRITLQRATHAPDGFNAPVAVWADLAELWAEVVPVSDRERVVAAEIAAEITHRFRIRLGPDWSDLSPSDRLIHVGRIHDIRAVREIGREGLEISAAARAD